MFSQLAKTDLERLRAAGFKPTDKQVIELNQLALQIERGKNTTAANAPRVAFAGNIVLHEPTIGALEWWHNFGRDAAWTTRGKLDVYYWMLANAANPSAFYGLEKSSAIRRTVRKWRRGVFATEGELWRALIYVKSGGRAEVETPKKVVASTQEEDDTMNRLWSSVIACAGALSLRPEDLATETVSTLTALLIQANLRSHIPIKASVAKDYIAYKLLIKEIECGGRKQ